MGTPLLLRGLLDAAAEDGALVNDTGRWRLTRTPRAGAEIEGLLESRVAALPAGELEVLEIVSAAEVLDWNALRALCDIDAISDAEQRGIIQVVGDPLRTVVRPGYPMLADIVRKRSGVARLRQINTSLAQHLRSVIDASGPARDPRLVIELARLMMDSDMTPDPDLVLDAAESAMAMSSLPLAERAGPIRLRTERGTARRHRPGRSLGLAGVRRRGRGGAVGLRSGRRRDHARPLGLPAGDESVLRLRATGSRRRRAGQSAGAYHAAAVAQLPHSCRGHHRLLRRRPRDLHRGKRGRHRRPRRNADGGAVGGGPGGCGGQSAGKTG